MIAWGQLSAWVRRRLVSTVLREVLGMCMPEASRREMQGAGIIGMDSLLTLGKHVSYVR